jgi:hypothetical protein
MRIDDGTVPVTEVAVHLTSDEAREMIATLTDLLDDIERIGLPESHGHLTQAEREITLFIYPDGSTLEADFAARIAEGR